MRPTMNKMRTLTGLMLLAGGLITANASAQSFSLELAGSADSVTPGATVPVNVILSGGPADTAAINFTVSSSGDVIDSIEGQKSAAATDFVYVDNNPVRTSGTEYRAVSYAPSDSSSVVDSSSATIFATLNVGISVSATPGETATLTFDRVGGDGDGFDTDSITGLIGVSNSAGQSQVPSGTPSDTRPGTSDLALTVVAPSTITDDPLNDPSGNEGWEFTQSFPLSSNATRLTGTPTDTHFALAVTETNTFGFYTRQEPIVPTQTDALMIGRWTIASDAENSVDAPKVRARSLSADNTYAVLHVYDEIDGTAPSTLPDASDGDRVLYTATYLADTVLDGNNQGVNVAFDIVEFLAPNTAGNEIHAKSYQTTQVVPVSELENETLLYSQDFENDGADGFTSFQLGESSNGLAVTTDTSGGLRVAPDESTTPIVGDNSGDLGNFSGGSFDNLIYNFGGWQKELGDDFPVSADKVYRVEAVVATSNDDVANTSVPTFRLRASFPSFDAPDFVHEAQFTHSVIDPTFSPSVEGKSYITYILPPQEIVGQSGGFAFDVWRTGANQSGDVTLKSVTISSFDVPSGLMN